MLRLAEPEGGRRRLRCSGGGAEDGRRGAKRLLLLRLGLSEKVGRRLRLRLAEAERRRRRRGRLPEAQWLAEHRSASHLLLRLLPEQRARRSYACRSHITD